MILFNFDSTKPMRRLLIITFIAAVLPVLANGRNREQIVGPVAADVVRVRDGDSIVVLAHVWPGHDVRVSIRLRGIDAPEIRGRCLLEKKMAIAARDRLVELVDSGQIKLTKISGGKYFGRMLARVHNSGGVDVQHVLLKEGLVRPHAGRKRQSWCPAKVTSVID